MADEIGCIDILLMQKDSPPILLGSGSTDAAGLFSIPLSRPLAFGDRIYPVDTCNGLRGPDVIVGVAAIEASTLSPAMMVLAIAAMMLAARLRLASFRR